MKFAPCLTIITCLITTMNVMHAGDTQAALIIDNFTDNQQIKDDLISGGASNGSMTLSASATSLTNARRTLTALANGIPNNSTDGAKRAINTLISAEDGILSFSNSEKSTGNASIVYDNFGIINFTNHADTFLIEILGIDLNAELELVINGTSSSGFRSFNSTGNFYIDFSDFGTPSELTSVQNLAMNIKGDKALDFDFNFSATNKITTADASTVPEPSIFGLFAIGLWGFGIVKRREFRF